MDPKVATFKPQKMKYQKFSLKKALERISGAYGQPVGVLYATFRLNRCPIRFEIS